MRRITKKFLFLFFGIIFTAVYCEFLIYYVVVQQCSWPRLKVANPNNTLKAFILADIHMLGPWRGHWLDKWRREWQMHQAYQAILRLHEPEVVFMLGDLFDEGEWTNENQFNEYVERFYRLFSVANNTRLHVVVGNHDIGFHNNIRRGSAQRFVKMLKSPSVQHLDIKSNHFILLNSMALHGDACNLCKGARKSIQNISESLNCAEYGRECRSAFKRFNYSRPIILQHFPLHRVSDAVCTDPDAPPLPERNKPFRLKIDSLSKEATDFLVQKLKPRVVFGGHTHHGCYLEHVSREAGVTFEEYSVPSFSWRNRPNPKYMLVTISPDDYAVNKCGLPTETTIVITAVIFIFITLFFTFTTKTIGR